MLTPLLRRLLLALACLGIGFAAPALAEDALSPAQKVEVERIVRDYLLKNPELLVEVMAELEKRQQEAEQAASQERIATYSEAIFEGAHDYVQNPEGAVPVVEFFDYQCGYCKGIYPALAELKQSQDDVRFIYKEFPILGDASTFAAKAAIAARAQGKYLELHDALMRFQGGLDEAAVLGMAEAVGLDMARLKRDMEAPEVLEAIQASHALARQLGIRGTPTLVIGDTLVPGAVPYERLLALVEESRKDCQVC